MRDPSPSTRRPSSLVLAALAATVGALAGREGGLPLGTACAAAAVAASVWLGRPGPWLCMAPAALAAIAPREPRPAWPRPGPVTFEGVVEDLRPGDRAGAGPRLRLRTPEGRAVLRLAREPWVLPGDRVLGVGRLGAPPPTRRPRLPTIVVPDGGLRVVRSGNWSWARAIAACRLHLQHALLTHLPGPRGVLLCHLVLGRGPPMPRALRAAHRATGLSHLLAVSGAHATMLGAMLGLLYRLLRGRNPAVSRRHGRACIVLLVVYGAITGMEPPVVRAIVAFVVMTWASHHGRVPGLAELLAAAALVTALLAPHDLLGVSFCLSYAAVVGLALAGALRAESWRRRWLRTPLLASAWATVTTTPLTLAYFGQMAPWTILATPCLAPCTAVMLGLGLVVSTADLVSPQAAALLAVPLDQIAAAYIAAVQHLALLPFAPVHAWSIPSPEVLGALGLLGAVLVWRVPRRASVAVACAALSAPYFAPPRAPADRLVVLDVGHGAACLVETRKGLRALVDCGSLTGESRAPRAVQRALRPARVLDLLVVTHGDFDHAGGIPELLEHLPVRRAVLPEAMADGEVHHALRARRVPVTLLSPGRRMVDGEVAVTAPAPDTQDANETSLWARFELGAFSAVVSGDALERGVRAWLARTPATPTDVVVLPHHGRENAATAELLARLRPALVLASNRPGDCPSSQARAARRAGIRALETGRVGTIEVLEKNGAVIVHTERAPPLRDPSGRVR